jgi:hypothetical protein
VRFVAFFSLGVSRFTVALGFSASFIPLAEVVVLAQFLATVKTALRLYHAGSFKRK